MGLKVYMFGPKKFRGTDTNLIYTKDVKAILELNDHWDYGLTKLCVSVCLRYHYGFGEFRIVERLELPTSFWIDGELYGGLGNNAITHRIKIDYKNSCARFSQFVICMCRKACGHGDNELWLEGAENASCMLVGQVPEEAVWKEMLAINEERINAEIKRLRKKPRLENLRRVREVS